MSVASLVHVRPKLVVKDGSDPSSFDYQSKALAIELHDHTRQVIRDFGSLFKLPCPGAVTIMYDSLICCICLKLFGRLPVNSSGRVRD